MPISIVNQALSEFRERSSELIDKYGRDGMVNLSWISSTELVLINSEDDEPTFKKMLEDFLADLPEKVGVKVFLTERKRAVLVITRVNKSSLIYADVDPLTPTLSFGRPFLVANRILRNLDLII
ncbi:MAG: hypothetical protein AAB694_01755 [Patescibacteria group bacterium]